MAARVVSFSDLKEQSEHLGKKINDLIHLVSHGFETAESFVITHQAYLDFLKENNIEDKIKHLNSVGLDDQIERHLSEAKLPENLVKEILSAYRRLGTVLDDIEVDINGQKIKGDAALIEKIKQIFISSYPANKLNVVVRKVHFGKHGKIRTSSKYINSSHPFNQEEVSLLETMLEKFKSNYYLPHEIDFTIGKGKVIINSIRPETHVSESNIPHETGYKVIINSDY